MVEHGRKKSRDRPQSVSMFKYAMRRNRVNTRCRYILFSTKSGGCRATASAPISPRVLEADADADARAAAKTIVVESALILLVTPRDLDFLLDFLAEPFAVRDELLPVEGFLVDRVEILFDLNANLAVRVPIDSEARVEGEIIEPVVKSAHAGHELLQTRGALAAPREREPEVDMRYVIVLFDRKRALERAPRFGKLAGRVLRPADVGPYPFGERSRCVVVLRVLLRRLLEAGKRFFVIGGEQRLPRVLHFRGGLTPRAGEEYYQS